MDHASTPTLRIGDLAAATGVTVRTVHHYEQIGLLEPAPRSSGGHRLYGADAVERLYRIGVLRRLDLSLPEIREVLERPAGSLAGVLHDHASALDAQISRLGAIRGRVLAAMGDLAHDVDPSRELMEVLSAMEELESTVRRRVSILVCQDPAGLHDWLVEVFGLTPGEVTYDGDRAVHAEVFAGDGVVWLHPELTEMGLASPRTLGAATATMAVMVDDVDAHHRHVVAHGGEIVYDPVDQPYGYREYSARDSEGTLWSFMRLLDPAPAPG